MKKLHKLTVLVVGSQGNSTEPDLVRIIQQNLDLFFNGVLKFLGSNKNLSRWSLRVLSGNSTFIDESCREVCDRNRISYDLLCLNGVPISSETTEKIIVFPSTDKDSESSKNQIRLIRNELGICFSDLVLLPTYSEAQKSENEELFAIAKEALLFGRFVVFLDPNGTINFLNPKDLPAWEITVLSQGRLDRIFVQRYAKVFSLDSINDVLINLDFSTYDRPAESEKELLESPIRKLSGRLDAFMSAVYSGLKWGDIKKGLKKNPFNEFYGVSVDDLPEEYSKSHPIQEPQLLRKAFTKFDKAANFFSGLYRDINWIVYSLSAFAVFSAIAGAIALGGVDWVWAITEVFAISSVILLVAFSKKYLVHEQWLSNRFRAESLRYLRVCLPFLIAPSTMKPMPANIENAELDGGLDDLHLIRRLVIDSGVSSPSASGAYVPSEHFDQLLRYAIHILEGQISFHKRTAHRNHEISHNLHHISFLCFVLTGVAILGHFIIHSDYWLLFTAALPALAGAIHGLATQNEFERIGQISIVTYEQLVSSRNALREKRHWDDLDDAQRFLRLQWLIKDAVEVMAGSARSWQDIVVGRATTLPA